MKILICSTGHNSLTHNDIGVFQLDQARALVKKGHDVRIASIDVRSIRKFRRFTTYSFEIDGINCATSNFPIGPIHAFHQQISLICSNLARKAYKEITKDGWRPDVVHAHFCGAASSFSTVIKEQNLPYVVTEHFSKINQEEISQNMLSSATKAYSAASVLIAVSSKLKDSIAKHTGYSAMVIPNMVDVDVFKIEYNKGSDPFVFITAGRLVEIKRINILIKAFAKLPHNTKLIVMGDGEESGNLQRLAASLNVANRIEFTGKYQRSEFNEYLGKANCFVLPSRSETFGVVYVEAMAAGLPVIATECGGPEEFINSDNGILVPVNDVEKLASAMRNMMENIENYDADAIADFVRKRYSPNRIVDQLEAVYQKVMANEQID